VLGATLILPIIALVACLIIGALIPLGGMRFGLLVAALVFGIFLYAYFSRAEAKARDLWFWVLILIIPLLSVFFSATGTNSMFLIELLLLASAPLTVSRLPALLREEPIWRVFIGLFSTYLCVAVLSSIAGRSMVFAATFQVATNIKFIFILLLGSYITWTVKTERIFLWVVQWFWVVLLPLVILQFVLPSTFQTILPYAAQSPGNEIFGNTRAVGIFRHPSYLGFYAGLFMLFSAIIARMLNRPTYWLSASVYFFLLAASGERHEMFTGVLLLVVAFGLSGKRLPTVSKLIAVCAMMLLLAAVITAVFWDYFIMIAEQMSLIGRGPENQPRSVLFADAFRIAGEYFPLGSGLSTFASAGAAKFDLRIYLEYGYGVFGWFDQNVLHDTYWPQHLAETGVFGLILMVLAFVVLPLHAASQVFIVTEVKQRCYWMFAFIGLLMVASVSLASPIIEDPGLSFLPFVLFSVALRRPRGFAAVTDSGLSQTRSQAALGRTKISAPPSGVVS